MTRRQVSGQGGFVKLMRALTLLGVVNFAATNFIFFVVNSSRPIKLKQN